MMASGYQNQSLHTDNLGFPRDHQPSIYNFPSGQQQAHQTHNQHTPRHSPAPPGTFAPGTKIRVGSHQCIIDRYLSEGGFAHVYVVKLDRLVEGTNVAVLKRVAVPDKDALASMRTEVDTMKRLKGHRHIVKYIDSHASHLQGGGYEVFLLMEFCAGGGLIDFMNTRLQNRLTEIEVLHIFSDAAEGVACMHYLQPPLLHRDLKIENILITPDPRTYKLCDFGSSAEPRAPGKTVAECRLIEEDVQKHTTLQYRSPEMIDVFRGHAIDEKSDIWALGVLLYKLCYYTTPFEDQGQLAILNASFKFPSYPQFSSPLKGLIGAMLQEDPKKRPNIYEILSRVCKLRGKPTPIKNIYSESGDRNNGVRNSTATQVMSDPQALVFTNVSSPVQVGPEIPHIEVMRRGRPPRAPLVSTQQYPLGSKIGAAESGAVGDPFAALDLPVGGPDASSRFPSVEQFSLLHEHGTRFEFKQPSPSTSKQFESDGTSQVSYRSTDRTIQQESDSSSQELNTQSPSSNRSIPITSGPFVGTVAGARVPISNIAEVASRISGLESSPRELNSKSPTLDPLQNVTVNSVPENFPKDHGIHRASSPHLETSRPSRWPQRPISAIGAQVASQGSQRPKSTHIESNLEFLRDLDSNSKAKTLQIPESNVSSIEINKTGRSVSSLASDHIESSVDFLRVLQSESDINSSRRSTNTNLPYAKHSKRSSVTNPNTKSLFAGRFGDAFRRFEGGIASSTRDQSPGPRLGELQDELGPPLSELQVTSSEIPAEIRREIEKRELQEEERRVSAATSAHKMAVAAKDPSKRTARVTAEFIQHNVRSSLHDKHGSPRLADTTAIDNTGRSASNRRTLPTSDLPSEEAWLDQPIISNSRFLVSRDTRPRPAPKPEKLRQTHGISLNSQVPITDTRFSNTIDKLEKFRVSDDNLVETDLLDFQKRYPSLSAMDFEPGN